MRANRFFPSTIPRCIIFPFTRRGSLPSHMCVEGSGDRGVRGVGGGGGESVAVGETEQNSQAMRNSFIVDTESQHTSSHSFLPLRVGPKTRGAV